MSSPGPVSARLRADAMQADEMETAERTPAAPATVRLPRPSLLAVVGAAVVLWGLVTGLRPLFDNSFLTHLATGRLILDDGIPRADPYSFTAPGHPWVVQSWLASVVYAGLERQVGDWALVVLHGAQTALLALLAWRLTRPANSLIARIVAVSPVVALGGKLWSSRPLLFGLTLFAVTILLAEDDRRSPRWLVPAGWVWVNTHGSFPFGPIYLGLRAIGRRLDQRPPRRIVRLFAFSVAGTVLGALNPLGLRLLLFPVHLLGQRAVLSHVIEWQSPDFTKPENLIFLGHLLLALLLLMCRPSWEDGIVAAVFGLLGAVALRNTAVASFALAPVLARGLGRIGSITGERRSLPSTAAFAAIAALGLVLTIDAARGPAFSLRSYPVHELDWMQRHDYLAGRVATQDFVGNLRTLRDGRGRNVFFDDRFDMYPRAVGEASFDLLAGRPDYQAILDRYRVDTVLWEKKLPLAVVLQADRRWSVVHSTKSWVVVTRAGRRSR
jgi:hypothetical protein